MKKSLMKLLAVVSAMLCVVSAHAQFTTSTMTGRVTDESGEPLVGATVIAVHTPSGTQYFAVANEDGYYTMQGLRPGGPYEVTTSLVGCQTLKYNDITLKLSETFKCDVVLKTDTRLLNEAVVVASATKFGTEKTGASTNVSNREMMNLPNSDRSIKALTKLSPYANGMSFAGGDGRSTNFTVDGANFNNNFGLSSNLPGGGTPISLDAIEEVQLVVAPFDVRQSNFVGGGINAVTKSGTNTFKGTAYGYYQDENFRGNKIQGEDLGERKPEMIKTYGFTLGGPIIKNKLFFFTNFEMNDQPGQAITTTGKTSPKDLQRVYDRLVNDYGYNPGSYTDFPGGISNMKFLARIDWNINDNHKLALRYNKTKNTTWYSPNGNSCDDGMRNKAYNRASNESQPFSNNMYSQQNDVTSFVAELNSRFGNKASNQILATYSFINDQRGTNSDIFPHIDICQGYDADGKFTNVPATSLGYELFTYKNGVTNKTYNIADNFTYYAGDHTLTAGASYEHMFADNSYIRNGTGYYRFASIDDFVNGNLPLTFCVQYNYDNAPETARINYDQYAAYVQDDWKVTSNFKLNYGVRFDLLAYDNDDLITNNAIKNYNMGGKYIDTGLWPKPSLQVNPRVGFNWDVNGDKSLILRGGTGMFQGRLPLVFFTNMPTNSGMILYKNYDNVGKLKDGQITYSDNVLAMLTALNGGKTTGGKVVTDVATMRQIIGGKSTISADEGALTGTINGVDRNFKMPQVWKTSFAVDYQVPVEFPMTVTAEGMFTKTIYGTRLMDWNINDSKISESNRFAGADNRYNFRDLDYTYGKYTAYVLTNTNKGWGYTANITINATPVKYLDVMAAYTHTESYEISGMPGSDASSAYTNLYSVDGPNFTGLHCSEYMVPDKVMANISYFIPFKAFHGNGLHLNLYYSGYSPAGYSYIVDGDLNGDGNAADLLYIPNSADELQFVSDADKNAFWKFVEQDKYLSKHKGGYAEAYGARAPWTNRFDARIAEDFSFKTGKQTHNFQISVSIDNIGNLINSNWGLTHLSYTGVYGTYTNPVLSVDRIENNKPVYKMTQVNGAYPTETWNNVYKNYVDCWHVLIGLKYFFN